MNRSLSLLTTFLLLTIATAAQNAPDKPSLTLKDPVKDAVAMSETTIADQTDVAVTVYNNDRALVRDRRSVKLLPGQLSLKFMDVAEQIQPETVSLKSLSAPGKLRILEQNYEYDLMSPQKLMEKYVGRDVRLINRDKELDFAEVNARLLSVNEGPVYQVDGSIYLGHPGTVVLPEIPEELIAKPSLIWRLDNDATDHDVEATYLTGGFSWKADYVITLDKAEKQMDLGGWVTLNNRSGATYQNAQLKVVAGEVNIVQPQMAGRGYAMAPKIAIAEDMVMREESFAEYHLYTLPGRTTIKQNQSKQVSLLSVAGIGVRKVYEYRGNDSFYSQRIPPIKEEKVSAMLVFDNKEANQLGMPLPAGIMRVYQEDRDGMLQFAGEDQIKHTPKNEEVRLRLGNAFDIVGERTQTDYRRIADNVHEVGFEIVIRNHKAENIVVDVIEPMNGDWEILSSSPTLEKKDAQSAICHLPVATDGEAKLTYRVRVKY